MECMPTLRVQQLRKAAGLTQQELAAKTELTQSSISRIESGKQGSLDGDVAERLARALGCSVDDLWDESSEAPPSTASHDAAVIPSLEQRPGWTDVFARAKADAPDIDAEDWETLAKSPGLFAFDAPLTPALLIDLARVVRRHRPPKR